MGDSVSLVVGDTGSTILATLKDAGTGFPVDLTGAAVALKYKIGSGSVVNKSMTVLTPATNGQVKYKFHTGDLSSAGTFTAQIIVTFADTSILTFEQFDGTVTAPLS